MTETLFRTFAASDLEVRATGRTIVGWAARFNEPTLIGGDHGTAGRYDYYGTEDPAHAGGGGSGDAKPVLAWRSLGADSPAP